ncbi:DUF2383 domain-containing protein [Marinobacter salicampi]|uniref:DUF2383 domain-containing protein n=1 Tax=Marinobacter salicampi TaxID=435907 RepID=UPI0014084A96|nr:DUF2383 domain-containing protein [Marinobacter salicampi]
MVDFTKSVNNQQMVDGLNKVLRLNRELASQCESAKGEISDPDTSDRIERLRQMHEDHIEKIGQSVRFLGGAPRDSGFRLPKVGLQLAHKDDQAVLSSLEAGEEKLHQTYKDTILRLSASGEVVQVLNEVLDEARERKL